MEEQSGSQMSKLKMNTISAVSSDIPLSSVQMVLCMTSPCRSASVHVRIALKLINIYRLTLLLPQIEFNCIHSNEAEMSRKCLLG